MTANEHIRRPATPGYVAGLSLGQDMSDQHRLLRLGPIPTEIGEVRPNGSVDRDFVGRDLIIENPRPALGQCPIHPCQDIFA